MVNQAQTANRLFKKTRFTWNRSIKTRMKKLKAKGGNVRPPAGEDLPVEGEMPSSEPPSEEGTTPPRPPIPSSRSPIPSPRPSTSSTSPRQPRRLQRHAKLIAAKALRKQPLPPPPNEENVVSGISSALSPLSSSLRPARYDIVSVLVSLYCNILIKIKFCFIFICYYVKIQLFIFISCLFI